MWMSADDTHFSGKEGGQLTWDEMLILLIAQRYSDYHLRGRDWMRGDPFPVEYRELFWSAKSVGINLPEVVNY